MTTKLSKHTPGPWTASVFSALDGFGIYAEGKERSLANSNLYEHTAYTGFFGKEETAANARLIAAAPALLEALEEIAAHSLEFDVDEIRYIAKEAIRAAVGAQEENTK